jgi:hypothetical protein
MSFALYLVGFLVVIVGLTYGAFLLNVPPRWIVVMDVVLVGLAILTGVTRTRHRDQPE